MNKQESDILNVILQYHCRNQRALAERCGFSLGMVNRSVKALQGQGFLTTDMELTEKARLEMAKHRPKNAVILAAGYGMRMVPINMETPKGLLEVEGEPLIERLIRQLHAVKVKEIYVVVGFKKEQYDYLVDRYGVKLVVNMEYAEKNNLHSLAKILPQLGETYLMPCDLWCRENPFSEYEWYSWYLVSDAKDPDSTVRVSRKWELVPSGGEKEGNHMIGISYLTDSVAQSMARRIETMVQDRRYDHVFWEDALFAENGMPVQAKIVPEGAVVEINTYEQLRELDENSDQLKSDAMAEIERVLSVSGEEITGIEVRRRSEGGAAETVRIEGEKGSMEIEGEYQIRKFLSAKGWPIQKNDGTVSCEMELLPSACFIVVPEKEGETVVSFTFYGGGYGHGVGMSQCGAVGYASEQGMNYKNILKHYYTGASISTSGSSSGGLFSWLFGLFR